MTPKDNRIIDILSMTLIAVVILFAIYVALF